MSGLNLVGIYPMQLERAIETLGEVCAEHEIDDDELWRQIWQEMDERYGTKRSHLSNRIVGILFDNLAAALEESGMERNRIDFYINGGLDTHFYIDGEEV